MAYSNNTSLYYPTPPVSGEFGSYQFLGQTLTTEEVNGQAENTFNQWDTIRGWPGPMAGSPTSLRVTVSYGEYYRNTFVDWCLTCEFPESVASVTSYENWGSGYDLPSYPGTFSPQLAAVSIPTAVIEG